MFGKLVSIFSPKQKKSAKSFVLFAVMTLLMVFTMSFGVFASTAVPVVDSSDFEPLLEGITANMGVLIPVGIGIITIIIGASFIPQIIGMFRRGR